MVSYFYHWIIPLGALWIFVSILCVFNFKIFVEPVIQETDNKTNTARKLEIT